MSFFKELKRRNVFKVGIAYAVTTWVLLQLTDTITQILALPEWAPKLILLMLFVGFVPALILAWAFELTPEGIKLEKDVKRNKSITPKTGRKLDYVIIVSLGLSLGYFIWESRFEQETAALEATAAEVPVELPEAEVTEPVPEIDLDVDIDANSIAVLPFANRSAGKEDIYFTDGIHDDLLTQLSKIGAFSVISRTSVMEYRDTTKNLRQIAGELRVANIMEGSVQRAGDRVRINVQLIDAKTDEHLWAEIYDRELTTNNLFDIQSEIAVAIASALKSKLSDSELQDVADVPTENVIAYDLYLQGKHLAQRETRQGNLTNLDLLREALKLDPTFKLAWVGLARAHMMNYWLHGGGYVERDKALDAIEHARNIDNDFAELFVIEGIYWYWGFLDYDRALYNLEKAIAIMPGNSEAHMWRGWVSRRAGLWDQAVRSMQKSLKLNPRVHFNWHEYAVTQMYLHEYEQAESAARESIKLGEGSFWGRKTLADITLQSKGDTETAYQLTIGLSHDNDFGFYVSYRDARLLSQRFDDALLAARDLPEQYEVQREIIAFREAESAIILHYMGRSEEAESAANAAMFRLNRLRADVGNDYRMDQLEASMGAILGVDQETVRSLIMKSEAERPPDDVERFKMHFRYSQIYAIAGMTKDAIETLEPLFQPPSETSVNIVDLDPAFNNIRTDPAFMAMLEKAR